MIAALLLLRTNWKLALILTAVAVSFGLGWWASVSSIAYWPSPSWLRMRAAVDRNSAR